MTRAWWYVETCLATFLRDRRQGYVTHDKTYAIEMLTKAIAVRNKMEAQVKEGLPVFDDKAKAWVLREVADAMLFSGLRTTAERCHARANELDPPPKPTYDELKEALQWFVERVDKGEVKSVNTYKRFKELLARV